MNLIKTSLLSSIATIVRTITGFVVVKFLSIYTGPSGLALISNFQSFISVFTGFANGAISNGVIKYTSDNQQNESEKVKLWSTAFRSGIYMSMLFSVVIFIFNKQLSLYFFKSENYKSIFNVLAITFVFFVLNALLLAILNGQKEIKKLVSVNIYSSVLSLFITVILAFYYGLYGALLSYATSQVIIFIVSVYIISRCQWFAFNKFTEKIDNDYVKKLLSFLSMALASAIAFPFAQILVRNYIGESIDWNHAGYWDGMWKISASYLSLITVTLSVYYLPRLSEINQRAELRKEIFDSYKIILPIISFLALIIYFYRDIIIRLLFTSDFAPMNELFAYQLVGDVLKIASWVLSYLMLAKAMTKIFIFTEIIFALSFVILSFYCINKFGVKGATIAFAINYFIYLCMMYFIMKRKYL